MALESFFNLKERKRNNLIEAIENCLKTQDYDDISINDIVKAADISRGSFYNYFNDKSDAVNTLVETKLRELLAIYKDCIIACGGKLFDGTIEAYNRIRDVMKNEVYVAFVKNIKFFIGMGPKIIYAKEFEEETSNLLDWLVENTEEGRTKLNTREKMANVLDLLVAIFSNITLRIVLASKIDLKYNDCEYKINIIRRGIMNDKDIM